MLLQDVADNNQAELALSESAHGNHEAVSWHGDVLIHADTIDLFVDVAEFGVDSVHREWTVFGVALKCDCIALRSRM